LIEPGDRWDLDHLPGGVSAPSHEACNRRQPMVDAGRSRSADRSANLLYDDPENKVFWSPPDSDGRQWPWSRPWLDWRNDPEYR
jgi:hypothetical protein